MANLGQLKNVALIGSLLLAFAIQISCGQKHSSKHPAEAPANLTEEFALADCQDALTYGGLFARPPCVDPILSKQMEGATIAL